MSDDPKEKPSFKLRLSRDLKDQLEAGEDEKPSTMKLKSDSAPNPETKTAPDSALDSEASTATNKNTASAGAADATDLGSGPTGATETPKTNFDPKNPFGNRIKDDKIKAASKEPSQPSQPPPVDQAGSPTATHLEKPGQVSPEADAASAAKLEANIDSLNVGTSQSEGKSSVLVSIVVMLVLLMVVCGAGFGLWKILKSPQKNEATSASPSVPAKLPPSASSTGQAIDTAANPASQSESHSKSAIEKARDAVSKVPEVDFESMTAPTPTGQASDQATTDAAEAARPPVNIVRIEQATPAAVMDSPERLDPTAQTTSLAQTAPLPNITIEASKQAVSEYLSNVHIGGIRKGDRPMVLLEGERFLVGDIVQESTGLKFDGIRDERLAFRDSHGIVYIKSF